ncbi:hypothetical protein GCM10010129_48240 [Streptomyces fumigatiscleroticus]|nr:hypothetical protein GCM10010129_48240 [Streptomyces fumigatiscleroticus]
MSAAYTREQAGQREARRFPQVVSKRPEGSSLRAAAIDCARTAARGHDESGPGRAKSRWREEAGGEGAALQRGVESGGHR